MRNAEYLWHKDTDYYLLGRCETFVHRVMSSEAFTSGLTVDTLEEILIDHLSAKNDASGAGHRL